jgi:hypothetical protein
MQIVNVSVPPCWCLSCRGMIGRGAIWASWQAWPRSPPDFDAPLPDHVIDAFEGR